MSVEDCPYCGKPFKRLKSHLPHCKMTPVTQPLKSVQTPQEFPQNTATVPTKKSHEKMSSTEKKNVILVESLTSKDRKNENNISINKKSVHNAESSLMTTKVISHVSTERSKSKWFAKRLKESDRLQYLPASQKSLLDHEGDKNISIEQSQRASQTNGKPTEAVTPLSELLSVSKSKNKNPAIQKSSNLQSERSLCHENPKLSGKNTDMKESKQNSHNSDLNPVSTVKELRASTFFASKTSVWDHIKGSLYKRSCNLLASCPILAFETKDISAAVPQLNKLETTKVSSTTSIHFSKSSIWRPVEDVRSSGTQGVRSLGWNPEIMTAFRILFSAESFRNSSNENIWNKRQFPAPSSHSKVPLVKRKIGDVKLNELAVWLTAQSPESPREVVTVLKQGWQWYYWKYIDVRRGGIGGISQLFAGYCVLCYIWRYTHLKEERWRKYH